MHLLESLMSCRPVRPTRLTRVRFPLWAAMAACLALVVATTPAWAEDDLLSEQRWEEHSYGLSLRPPLDAVVLPQTGAGDTLATFIVQGLCEVKLFIRTRSAPAEVKALKEQALLQFGFAYPSTTVIDDQALQVAGHPAVQVYSRVSNKKDGDWIYGHTIVEILPTVFAVLEFRSDAEQFEESRPIFDAMVRSIDMIPPEVLARHRQAILEVGQQWRGLIRWEDMVRALVPEQWLRVRDRDGKDVGYIRIRQHEATVLNEPGIQVQIQSRVTGEAGTIDTTSESFISVDGFTEVWSIRRTQRGDRAQPQMAQDGSPMPHPAWAETGLRSGSRITITREGPGEMNELTWQMPSMGYLSQVDLHLLPQMLPRDSERELGFYAYYPSTGEMALRSWRVVPMEGGGYRVYDRPAPNRVEQVTLYDAQGQLVEQQTLGGGVIVPATAEQIEAIWSPREKGRRRR